MKPLLDLEEVELDSLERHPRNYREHPEDQIAHIIASIEEYGFYKNIVISQDDVLLAGHGVAKAAIQMGKERAPVFRLRYDHDHPKALKLVAADNEIDSLAIQDQLGLTEILKEIADNEDEDLLGTGFDDKMLASLVFVTRPRSEIETIDEAAHWVGMPEFEPAPEPIKITISFRNDEDRERFVKEHDLEIRKRESRNWSTYWPAKDIVDAASTRFESDE